LVSSECISWPAFIQPGREDFVLEAITYGSGCFLSYEGIFITSKRRNGKVG
jgi:hypothetical protein